jgi:ATP phosphoribosyltransferase
MEDIIMMLKSVIDAVPKVCIMMNVPENRLSEILALLPTNNPTVSHLAKGEWVDIMAVIDDDGLRELFPKLKAHGAKSIAQIPVNKIID